MKKKILMFTLLCCTALATLCLLLTRPQALGTLPLLVLAGLALVLHRPKKSPLREELHRHFKEIRDLMKTKKS